MDVCKVSPDWPNEFCTDVDHIFYLLFLNTGQKLVCYILILVYDCLYDKMCLSVQSAAALVPVPGLQQRHQGGVRGGGARHLPLRTHLLLRLRRELARPGALLST